MRLSFSPGTESDAGDSVSSHNGYAVGGECPLVCQRAALAHFQSLLCADPLVPVEGGVGFFESLCYLVILRDRPCREVALDLIDASGVGRTVIVVHGYDNVIAVFLYAWQGADLVQAALPCLAECHAAVKRYRAGVGNRASAR